MQMENLINKRYVNFCYKPYIVHYKRFSASFISFKFRDSNRFDKSNFVHNSCLLGIKSYFLQISK